MPQSARLSAGGSVQWLFGQCPNELLYFYGGASLTALCLFLIFGWRDKIIKTNTQWSIQGLSSWVTNYFYPARDCALFRSEMYRMLSWNCMVLPCIIVTFGIFCYLINGIWYILLPYKWYCMVLYYIVLRSWLRRAGCVSQDAYILHRIKTNKPLSKFLPE